MGISRVLSLIVVASLVPAAFGCAETEPYVYSESEFDREAKGFGKELADISVVEICYSKHSTTVQALEELANARCGEYGKVARYRAQGYGQCPLMTPVHAIFACLKE